MNLPHSAPSAQGVDAAGLLAFLAAVREHDLGLHGVMVARHGHVIAQGWVRPYAADRAQLVYSLSKTLTATAVGLLVQEGRLGLDDLVLDHLPEVDREGLDDHWSRVRVRHCLSMTVGHETDAWAQVVDRSDVSGAQGGDDWVVRALATRPTAEPGTVFAYNQVATYLLSVIVARLGGGVREVLRPRVLDPLGIGEVLWHTDPQGRELGFSGAHLRTGDVLALAQLYLDGGVWQGERLLAEAWVAEATVAFGPLNEDPGAGADWRRGYGYSFWMQQVGFRGDGAYGQFLIVLPEHDVAIAITSEHERMQTMLDLLWEHLVPAVGRAGSESDDVALERALDGLALEPLAGAALGPDTVELARSGGSTLASAYTAVSVAREGAGHVVSLHRGQDRLPVAVGAGEWLPSVLVAQDWSLPVVASGGWVDEDTFRAEVRVIETPHSFAIEGRVGDGEVDLAWRMVPLMGRDPFGLAARPA